MTDNSTTDNTESAPTPVGTDAIRHALKNMPLSAGVYRMLNPAGDVLYVGKAKNLKNRVSNYVNISALSTRIMRMVSQTVSMEWTICGSEAEALLVEANFIKKLKPRYNILLKDDKSFPYLMFTDHAFPRIKKHRGTQSAKAEYFGPFASVGALNQALSLMQKVFLLRPCADTIYKNRTRPCLQYQIKRCSAPCVGYVSEEAYAEQLHHARQFLRGKSRDVQAIFQAQMEQLSNEMQFERAAIMRDRIRALTQIQQEHGLNTAGLSDADVISLHYEKGRAAVQVMFFRQAIHFGHHTYHPTGDEDASAADMMAAFIGQFYQAHTPPREILVNIAPSELELLCDALSLRAPYRVELHIPLRGDKRSLMEQALAQTIAAHTRALNESMATTQYIEKLALLFHLNAPPSRIEVFDNSHIMGSFQLGAMIVATPQGFKKSSYRQFNRHAEETIAGDDISMMREMMRRRFRGVKPREDSAKTEADDNSDFPDLLLIDGGITQFNAVINVLDELGLASIPVVAIAKGVDRNAGREWFFTRDKPPYQLPVNDPILHYLERLRDEAHRFAIGSHRNKRSRALTRSTLDDIAGIGPKRKKSLLNHFGSRAGVEAATLSELQKVEGINEAIAAQIFAFFHQ